MASKSISVAVLCNHTGVDEYEKLRTIDPSTLDFKPEYNIHVATALEEYTALTRALQEEGFRARLVNVREDVRVLQRALTKPRPDVVFNLIEHFHDEPRLEMAVANLFELYGISYTGAPAFALALCQRKGLTKQILLANGVPTPRYRLLKTPELPKRLGLRFPLIVKPAREDASSGVEKDSVVRDYDELRVRVEKVFAEFAPPILIEEYVEGRELHVSVLGNEPPVVLPMIEYDFSELPVDHPRIISFAAKWDPLDEIFHRVHTICPAKVPKRIHENIEKICLRAYEITGCRDYARVDIRLSRQNHPYVLEVNPNPDLTEGVSFMESAEKGGLTFSRTLRRIVEYALERCAASGTTKVPNSRRR